MYIKNFTLFLFSILYVQLLNAQLKPAEGFFTSEAATASAGDNIIISIKKYNPTADEIKNAITPVKNAPMKYLQAPVEATNISLFDKGFESLLYCLDKDGNEKWNTVLGYSKNSSASPVASNGGFIYAGAGLKDADKVTIQKMDVSGKLVWKSTMDSLQNVNSIYVDETTVNALVSFESSHKVADKNGTFSFQVYPIYFFVQLDIATGKIIKKEYQMMGNYLSQSGYGHPFINTSYSYYLNNKDSAIFLNSTKQNGATVVSEDKGKDASILELVAGNESYHYLALSKGAKHKITYQLFSSFYGKDKKYQSELPVKYEDGFRRYFLYKNGNDSLLTVIQSAGNISLVYTDTTGKSDLYKTVADIASPIITTGIQQGKTYLVYLEGRNKPGIPGKIKISYY